MKLYVGVEKAVERLCRWILRYVKDLSSASSIISKYTTHVATLESYIDNLIKSEDYPEVRDEESLYISANVPAVLAKVSISFGVFTTSNGYRLISNGK